MSRTTWTGPLASGTLEAGVTGGSNVGLVMLSQTATLGYDTTLVQSTTFNLPASSQIVDFFFDVLTAYNSATSATLSLGSAAAGTQYASGVNVKAATGRIAATLTSAQLTSMADISTNTSVVATVTSVGQPTAGATRVTVRYVQTGS